ncbi:hypothetical protein [Flavobacterium sp. UBA7680]|uniref:hypothetical protein n=1 Tax=Flavobacterium sp. UBA7680 TaxID=1946559 RepID=UPI0025C428ED|nr:hypothetical protein [Flavobacterium sp. UBA7680]
MEKKQIRFIKSINLRPTSDFNEIVTDKIYRAVGDAYNSTREILIDDFLGILTIQNLTRSAHKNFIENDFKIEFSSIGLNFQAEKDRKPKKINLQNRDSFKFGNYLFLIFSKNYDLVYQDKEGVKVIINETEVKFNLQELKTMGIEIQPIDY